MEEEIVEAKLIPLPIDSLTVCAYADKEYAGYREYWISFLKLLLPPLLDRDNGEIEEMIDFSTITDLEEATKQENPASSVGALMRHISAFLSLQMGKPSELGVAAFLDCDLPTRMHWVHGSVRDEVDDTVFIGWFGAVSKAQDTDEFLAQVELWRDVVDSMPMEHLAQTRHTA